MVLTVSCALSPATGLSCHRRPWEACFSRTWHQRRGVRTTRLLRPQESTLVFGATRVHRIPPNVRDDRETPLETRRDGRHIQLIWVGRQAKFRKIGNSGVVVPGWSEGPDLRCAIAHRGIPGFRVRAKRAPRNDRLKTKRTRRESSRRVPTFETRWSRAESAPMPSLTWA